jgi:acetyl-CoA carboxylase carboxyltransferase component
LHEEEIYGIYDSSPARPYDMKEILGRIVDGSAFDEYKPEYGKTIICGYARIGGFAVGIVANQNSTRSKPTTRATSEWSSVESFTQNQPRRQRVSSWTATRT